MTSFEQMQAMKQSLLDDLMDAVDRARVHVGHGLCETDVIGVIEKVKIIYVKDMDDA